MERLWGRRQFLGGAVALGGTTLLVACGKKAQPNSLTSVTANATGGPSGGAFQLSTRRQKKACKACQAHAHNRVYATRAAAEANRAHPGCNCHIAPYAADAATLSTLFPGSKTVHDKRSS
jgi:hypothetical protein